MGIICSRRDSNDNDTAHTHNNISTDHRSIRGSTNDRSSSSSNSSKSSSILENELDPTTVVGDIRCYNATIDPEILCSVKRNDRAKQEIQFLVELPQPQPWQEEELVICWVDRKGRLRSHDTYPNSHDRTVPTLTAHKVQSFTGDAFVLYKSYPQITKTKPATITELTQMHDESTVDILCSYRISTTLPPNRLHQIQIKPRHNNATLAVCITSSPLPDNEYRVVVFHPDDCTPLPPYTSPWTVTYKFICPPLPTSSPTFHKTFHTFYIWGDLAFKHYGPNAGNDRPKAQKLHNCQMNQIVPQIMTGRCLSSNNKRFEPEWEDFDEWVLQAQYYWQTELGEAEGSRAMCGELIRGVKEGDLIRSTIRYDPLTGKVHVSIAVGTETEEGGFVESEGKRSDIEIDRPFPHDSSLFQDWKDFFRRCQAVEEEEAASSTASNPMSIGPLARPSMCVEYKGSVDVPTMKAVCPFDVREASYPGALEDNTKKWRTQMYSPRLGYTGAIGDLNLRDAVIMGGVRGGVPSSRRFGSK